MKILVTGNCGFIGQNFVRLYKERHQIWGIDKMSYASDKKATDLCKTINRDICNIDACEHIFPQFDVIINFAAESHVDNSITSPEPFVRSNIEGTFRMLEFAKKQRCKYIQVSTDEVYGDLNLEEPPFSNLYEFKPSSPYSASKASADCLVMAYNRTYGLDTIITRSCNNYGPYQYKEKLIPVVIENALNNKPIPLYGDGLNMREWIYVEENCEGIMAALKNGKSGGIYNLGSGIEYTNKKLIEIILDLLGKPQYLIKYVGDRKGHDRRYALNSIETYNTLNWKPELNIYEGLKKTIEWYIENLDYWGE